MKKIIIWSLLTLASIQSHAEEITAHVVFSNEQKKIIAIVVNSKDQEKRLKCEEIIISNDGREIIKKQAEKINQRVLKLTFTCNL
ncbi:hypothetical protein F885_03024 [Acinetobacter higginsii]|uniref:hypothetical protein n=1 Tax=Acinetobacter higginsii TaxID=70347 RepID=UPI0002D0FEB9|nr:hypothetical protein [Acinetobacter higginsii]ENX56868.1 hypothetical protein F885_03024 [Acinetobacter higginsii]